MQIFSYNWAHYRLGIFFVLLETGAIFGLKIDEPLLGIIIGLGSSILVGSSGKCETFVSSDRIRPENMLKRISVYIDGKVKRYYLLFSVNGGAFVIAKLASDESGQIMGMLTLPALAFGAIIFTAVMIIDIWLWGHDMRNYFVGQRAFTFPGRAIALLIGGLVICGWFLVTLPTSVK